MHDMIDVLTVEGKTTGRIASRSEVHRLGLWHQTVHIWIYNKDGQILLQKRSAKKTEFPGYWDISVGGHLDAGENPISGAIREVKEELNLDVTKKDLQEVGVRKTDYREEKNGLINKEFNRIFLLKLEHLPTDLSDEVECVKFFWPSEILQEIAHQKKEKFVPHGKYYTEIIEIVEKANTRRKNL